MGPKSPAPPQRLQAAPLHRLPMEPEQPLHRLLLRHLQPHPRQPHPQVLAKPKLEHAALISHAEMDSVVRNGVTAAQPRHIVAIVAKMATVGMILRQVLRRPPVKQLLLLPIIPSQLLKRAHPPRPLRLRPPQARLPLLVASWSLIRPTDVALLNSTHVKTASPFAPPIPIALTENIAGPRMKTTAEASPREPTTTPSSPMSSAVAERVN